MSSVNVNFAVEGTSAFWHFNIEKLQILDFSEQTYENWVEVNSYEAFAGNFGLFFYEKELVKLFFGIVFNSNDPLSNFSLLEFVQILIERVVELLNIFELFTLLKSGAKGQ